MEAKPRAQWVVESCVNVKCHKQSLQPLISVNSTFNFFFAEYAIKESWDFSSNFFFPYVCKWCNCTETFHGLEGKLWLLSCSFSDFLALPAMSLKVMASLKHAWFLGVRMKRDIKVKLYFPLCVVCVGITFSDYSFWIFTDVSFCSSSEQLVM